MEKARRNLRICLIALVIVTIAVGCIYYFGDIGKSKDISKGTLVIREVVTGAESRG